MKATITGKDMLKFLSQGVIVIGKRGAIRLSKKGEEPTHAIGFIGHGIAMLNLKDLTIQFIK